MADKHLGTPRPLPEVLVAKGRARYGWLLVWLVIALLFIVPTYTDYVGGYTSFLDFGSITGAVALICGTVSVRGFQRGIRADENGITVVNFLRRIAIPWHELRDIGFKQVDSEAVAAMYHTLVFTVADRKVTAQAPGGGNQPGEYLYELRETLLAMRAANALPD